MSTTTPTTTPETVARSTEHGRQISRLAELDAALVELKLIVDEADQRIATASNEVVRATGGRTSYGPRLRQVTVSRGDAPPWRYDGGQSDEAAAADEVLATLEAEAAPARAALASVEAEHVTVRAALDAADAETGHHAEQQARAEAERAERETLIGTRLDWGEKAAAVLARLAASAGG